MGCAWRLDGERCVMCMEVGCLLDDGRPVPGALPLEERPGRPSSLASGFKPWTSPEPPASTPTTTSAPSIFLRTLTSPLTISKHRRGIVIPKLSNPPRNTACTFSNPLTPSPRYGPQRIVSAHQSTATCTRPSPPPVLELNLATPTNHSTAYIPSLGAALPSV